MLPGIGFSELLLLGLAALIIVGPKDLPMMMRRIGQFVGKGRAMAREFQAAFEDIARQSEQDDLAAFEADVNSAVMEKTSAPEPEAGSDAPDTAPKTGGDAT